VLAGYLIRAHKLWTEPGTQPLDTGLLCAVIGLPLWDGRGASERADAGTSQHRTAALFFLVIAVLHLALIPAHLADDPLTASLFAINGVILVMLALVAVCTTRWWRPPAALMLMATLLAYLYYIRTGREGLDQVGLLSTLLEITALGLVLIPSPTLRAPLQRCARWVLATGAVVALTFLTGIVSITAISAQPPEKVKVRVGYGSAPHSGSLQVCKKPTPLRANCTMILATVCAHLSGNIGPA